jgi:hypothetical protein
VRFTIPIMNRFDRVGGSDVITALVESLGATRLRRCDTARR